MPGLNTSSVGQRRLAEQNKRRQAMSMTKSVPPTPACSIAISCA